jgi:hypothetical protein
MEGLKYKTIPLSKGMICVKYMKKKKAVCNTCTIKLVSIAYQRSPLFRLLREPLKLGMRLFAWWYRITPDDYQVLTPGCSGCIRFYKLALKDQSGLFRWLNESINPIFDAILERIVTAEEVRQAKFFARLSSDGEVKPEDARKWLQGQKTGF